MRFVLSPFCFEFVQWNKREKYHREAKKLSWHICVSHLISLHFELTRTKAMNFNELYNFCSVLLDDLSRPKNFNTYLFWKTYISSISLFNWRDVDEVQSHGARHSGFPVHDMLQNLRRQLALEYLNIFIHFLYLGVVLWSKAWNGLKEWQRTRH